jgi:hypothetical protein
MPRWTVLRRVTPIAWGSGGSGQLVGVVASGAPIWRSSQIREYAPGIIFIALHKK